MTAMSIGSITFRSKAQRAQAQQTLLERLANGRSDGTCSAAYPQSPMWFDVGVAAARDFQVDEREERSEHASEHPKQHGGNEHGDVDR